MDYVGIAGAILCRVGWAKQSDNPGKVRFPLPAQCLFIGEQRSVTGKHY